MRRRESELVAAAASKRLEELAEEFAVGGYLLPPPAPVPVPGRHANEQARRRWELPVQRVPGIGALERRHLGLIAAVAVVGVLLAWVVLRPGPEPVPLVSTSAVAAPAASSSAVPGAVTSAVPAGGATTAATGPPTSVVVDVAGKVRTPGVHALPAGSRVVDALRVAGGALPGVDLSGLNLARPLADGEQILVGAAGVAPAGGAAAGSATAPSAASGSAATPEARVSLNTATEESLEALPGIGPVTAGSIIAWRTEHGRFTTVEELLEVDGIGPKTLSRLTPRVTP